MTPGRRHLGLALVLALSLAAATAAHARPRLGLEVGTNVAWLEYDDEFWYWDSGWRPLLLAGGTVQFPLRGPFAITTGLRFVQKGNHVVINTGGGPDRIIGEFQITQNYVTVPLWIEIRPRGESVSLVFGPEFGLLTGARLEGEVRVTSGGTTIVAEDSEDIEDSVHGTDLALVFGATHEFPFAGRSGIVSVRYSHGLVGVAKEDRWATDWQTRGVEASVGLRW